MSLAETTPEMWEIHFEKVFPGTRHDPPEMASTRIERRKVERKSVEARVRVESVRSRRMFERAGIGLRSSVRDSAIESGDRRSSELNLNSIFVHHSAFG